THRVRKRHNPGRLPSPQTARWRTMPVRRSARRFAAWYLRQTVGNGQTTCNGLHLGRVRRYGWKMPLSMSVAALLRGRCLDVKRDVHQPSRRTARVAELADVADLKSAGGNPVQ